jgi:quercetin dioxygenase-like cupin family protein
MFMGNEFVKGRPFTVMEVIEYVPNSIHVKTLIKKTTGSVSVIAFDTGAAVPEKTLPYDAFIHIIDGKAEITVDGVPQLLASGETIVIPAHSRNSIKAAERFKMISTIIKSGIDEVAGII